MMLEGKVRNKLIDSEKKRRAKNQTVPHREVFQTEADYILPEKYNALILLCIEVVE